MTPIPPLLVALVAPLCASPQLLSQPGLGAPSEASYEAEVVAEGEDLTELSLEQLMNMEVSIASRSDDPLSTIPAAVYVLTGDEIRRAGHTSLQEALRMVPGFNVSRYGTSGWAVSARGFSGGFSNQLLIMIDGVSVYTPLFAGTWWELQDLNMADIERVEIVRGPGGSLWGANAVNGVVNVITKHTDDTLGTSVNLTYADDERMGTVRYGEKLDNGAFRVWAKGSKHNPLPDSNGDQFNDDWEIFSAGFRTDLQRENGDKLNFFGKAWTASIGESYAVYLPTAPWVIGVEDETPKFGGILSSSWEHEDSPDSAMKVTAWISRDHYKQVDWFSTIDILDVDFQRSRNLDEHKRLVWGLGYRLVHSDLEGDFTLTADPETRAAQTFRGYVQEQITFPSIDTRVTVGASVEHNDFTGLEFQPNVRAFWQATESQSVWAAISRAVRTPSLEEEDITLTFPFAPNAFAEFGPGPEMQAETMIAYEAGYRYQHNESMSLDIAAFFNDFDRLVTIEDGTPYVSGPDIFFPFYNDNLAKAEAFGVEAALDWDISDDWRVRSAFTTFKLNSDIYSNSTDLFFSDTDESTPNHQVNVRSYYDLNERWELDGGFYYVDSVPYFGTPSYTRVDLRLGYQPSPDWRFSVGVQNLNAKQHPEESENEVGFGSEVIRNVYFTLAWSH